MKKSRIIQVRTSSIAAFVAGLRASKSPTAFVLSAAKPNNKLKPKVKDDTTPDDFGYGA